MSHFALLDKNGIVQQVIVAEQEVVNQRLGVWVQTSYNTRGGLHVKGGKALRKNYAGIGYSYDKVRDAFLPPKPFPSWLLNETSCQWQPPVLMPLDGALYKWDEASKQWVSAYLEILPAGGEGTAKP